MSTSSFCLFSSCGGLRLNLLQRILTRGLWLSEMLWVILSVLWFCILIVPREEKKVYLYSFVLLGTVRSHGLFQLCKIVDQVCRGNLQKSLVGPCRPWCPHGGMTVGNRFIYQVVKTVCRTPARSVFTIYRRSITIVTAIAGVYVFLSSAKYVEGCLLARSLSVPSTEVRQKLGHIPKPITQNRGLVSNWLKTTKTKGRISSTRKIVI